MVDGTAGEKAAVAAVCRACTGGEAGGFLRDEDEPMARHWIIYHALQPRFTVLSLGQLRSLFIGCVAQSRVNSDVYVVHQL